MIEAFGAVAVSLMVLCYALEHRAPVFILAFAACCLLSASYAVLIRSWPFAAVETIWAAIAFHRWWTHPKEAST